MQSRVCDCEKECAPHKLVYTYESNNIVECRRFRRRRQSKTKLIHTHTHNHSNQSLNLDINREQRQNCTFYARLEHFIQFIQFYLSACLFLSPSLTYSFAFAV